MAYRGEGIQDMPVKRLSSAVASVLAAGLMLAVASCASHVLPLGPVPQPTQLGSPIVLQAMRVLIPSSPGACTAGYAALSAPGMRPAACYRQLGAPVTFTSGTVTPAPVSQPAGQPPSGAGLLIAVPQADVAALTAVTTRAYDSRGAVDISVDGKTWALPMAMGPLTHGQFEIVLPSQNQADELQRILVPSG